MKILKNKSLCLTGWTESWDREKDLLLLGPWCTCSPQNKKILETSNYEIIPSPWKPADNIVEAEEYCFKVYQRFLPVLADVLNQYHGQSFPLDYWKVLLGPWLNYFVNMSYERFIRLKHAFLLYPEASTNVLPLEQCYLNLNDTLHFSDYMCLKNADYGNHILYSLICHYFYSDRMIVKDDLIIQNESEMRTVYRPGPFDRCLALISKILKPKIILSDMYRFNKTQMLEFLLKMGITECGFLSFSLESVTQKGKLDNSMRSEFQLLVDAQDIFEKFLKDYMWRFIPLCYMENFNLYRSNACKYFKRMSGVKKVVSAVGWTFNENLKFFAAEAVLKNKASVVEVQHGGGYGVTRSMPLERVAFDLSRFYSWGWTLPNNDVVCPLPNPYFSRIKDTHHCNSDDVLFVGTMMPAYPYRFHSIMFTEDREKYLLDKKIFLENLNDKLRKKILYRPYPGLGTKDKDFISFHFPKCRFLEGGVLTNKMNNASLVVIDHPHTSFLEALVMNVPCVLYWDPDVYLMKKSAEKYFNRLVDAEILFYDPAAAAKKVNQVAGEISRWWQSRFVQEAREEFCLQFALTNRNWSYIWAKEFKSL